MKLFLGHPKGTAMMTIVVTEARTIPPYLIQFHMHLLIIIVVLYLQLKCRAYV
jgi:hypothetical protein